MDSSNRRGQKRKMSPREMVLVKLSSLSSGGLENRIGVQNNFCLQSYGLNLLINRASNINRWNSLLLDSRSENIDLL